MQDVIKLLNSKYEQASANARHNEAEGFHGTAHQFRLKADKYLTVRKLIDGHLKAEESRDCWQGRKKLKK